MQEEVTSLESKNLIYTYHFDYIGLGTSYVYPTSNSSNYIPYHWMYCKDMTAKSRFHIHTISYDSDSSLSSSYQITFKLDFLKKNGDHIPKEVFTIAKRDKAIVGENLMFVDEKFSPSTLTGYQDFVMARLAIKGSGSAGNEVAISCSFEI